VFPANGIISICVATTKEAKKKTVVVADKRGKNLPRFHGAIMLKYSAT
jgi:hypothetical protein